MMRMVAILLVSCVGLVAEAQTMTREEGVDYRGADMRRDSLTSVDACEAACLAESACQAFTYVLPAQTGAESGCFLKYSVPEKRQNDCCVSGRKRNASQSPASSQRDARSQLPLKPLKPMSPTRGSTSQTRDTPNLTLPPNLVDRLPSGPNVGASRIFEQLEAQRAEAVEQAQARQQARNEAMARARRLAGSNTGPFRQQFDCDDSNASVFPGQVEVCNFIDDDCDGDVDEGVSVRVYEDADGDRFGNPANSIYTCPIGDALSGMTTNNTDCDDTNAGINPGRGNCS